MNTGEGGGVLQLRCQGKTHTITSWWRIRASIKAARYKLGRVRLAIYVNLFHSRRRWIW